MELLPDMLKQLQHFVVLHNHCVNKQIVAEINMSNSLALVNIECKYIASYS